jgi:hypothetical protein
MARLKQMQDTADEHFALAGWCKSQSGLRHLADAHYLRAIDLDPNHRAARAAAGFSRDADGRWVKRAKVMEEQRGKVLYRGSWRFPEELASEQAEEERNAKLSAVTKDINRWHNDAVSGSGKRQVQALESLEQLNDPLSISLIGDILQGKRRPPAPPALRLLYLRVLSRMQHPQAAIVTAHVSVRDADPAVRNAALESLQRDYYPAAVAVYLGYLRHKENSLVNLAAENLSRVAGEESILPLIEALVTEHTRIVGGGNTTYQAGGMAFGGKEQVQKYTLQNPSALGTLNQLTGQNLEYNKDAWLSWYARMYAPPAEDLRRDP